MDNYEDLIYMQKPEIQHIHMPIAARAKIFAPFAALKGYEEAIEETKRNNVDLYNEDKEEFYESI